jgi:hypothetical protein
MSRPVRSCRVKAEHPVLPEIISRINDLKGKYYENIRKEFEAVSKYFKDDTDLIAHFWLTHYEYNTLDFKHQFLLRTIFEKVGLKNKHVVGFLDKDLDGELLSKLGVVRVDNGKKTFYRIRVGIESE